MVEVAAAAEVGAGPGVVGGHDVPAGAAAGQQVEPAEAAGQVGRLVVRGVRGGDEADVGGDGGERGELGDRVRAAGDVEVVDQAVDLAQPQPLAEEERVEQAALGGLGDLAVRLGRDLRAAVGLGPDRPVVDALEEDAEVQLGVGPGDVGGVGAGHRSAFVGGGGAPRTGCGRGPGRAWCAATAPGIGRAPTRSTTSGGMTSGTARPGPRR